MRTTLANSPNTSTEPGPGATTGAVGQPRAGGAPGLKTDSRTPWRDRFSRREVPTWLAAVNPWAWVGRTVNSYRPSKAPLLTRPNFRREMTASLFLPWAIAAVEGGVLGVIVKKFYAGVVDDNLLNYAVAVVTAAPSFANIFSFVFARMAHGRHKVPMINALQIAVGLMTLSVGLAPRSPSGLLMVVAVGVIARVAMAGIVTLRSSIWRANYPRSLRGRLTGRISATQTLVSALVGLAIGMVLSASTWLERGAEQWGAAAVGALPAGPWRLAAASLLHDPEAWALRIALPVLGVGAVIGAMVWSRVRVRRNRALLRAEMRASSDDRPSYNPARMVAVLVNDRAFALYMLFQFIIGFGNMMCLAAIVILTEDRFGFGYRDAMLVNQVIPFAMIPLCVGLWSGLLDRGHVVRFRSIHTWVFVLMTTLLGISALAAIPWLLFVAAAVRGIGFAGGAIAWNLGHNDFASDENAAQYMAVHVTLTGLRGLIAPFAGVAIYEWLEASHTGAGGWLFVIASAVIAVGGLGFMFMARQLAPKHKGG